MPTSTLTIANSQVTFDTRPGVFAQYGLDPGSLLLLETIRLPAKKLAVLDLGCGCGVLGITLAILYPQSEVTLVDADIRAVRLTGENAARNTATNTKVYISDVVADIPKKDLFDIVVSNPPTHQGRETLMQFIKGAHMKLVKGGTAYFVVNRMESVLAKLETVFSKSTKLAKRQGYIVFQATK